METELKPPPHIVDMKLLPGTDVDGVGGGDAGDGVEEDAPRQAQ